MDAAPCGCTGSVAAGNCCASDCSANKLQVNMPKLFKALSDPTRYRIFCLLLERHHCSRSLAQILGISEPAVSQQMAVLKDCGLVVGMRRCRHIHYRVDESVLATAINEMRGWANESRDSCDCHASNRCTFCERFGANPSESGDAQSARTLHECSKAHSGDKKGCSQ